MFRLLAVTLTALVGLSIGCSALAFQPPGPPQSDPPPTQLAPAETTEKSTTAVPKVAAITPVAPAPKTLGTRRTIMPGVLDTANWTDKCLFDPLTLIVTVENGTPEGLEAVAAAQELAADYVGRVSVQVEFVSEKKPGIFLVKQETGSTSRKVTVILRQHCVRTHVAVMTEQLAAEKPLAWTSQAYMDKISKDDGQRVLGVDDLTLTQLKKLSADSQKRWMNGQVDVENLRLWLEVIGEKDLKQNLKPGPACFRIMDNDNFMIGFSTRLPQPIIFVHFAGRERQKVGEELEESARRVACYPDVRAWVVDADSTFGKDLHKSLSENKEKRLAGVAPPEDAASVILFQMTDNSLDPRKGKKSHWGPYTLDPKKSQADELERILDDLKLARSNPTLVVTQTTALEPTPRLKK